MVTIYLRSVQLISGKGPIECLELSDTNGGHGINNLETNVLAGTKIKWKLVKDSNIKTIVSVNSNIESTDAFSGKPQKVQGTEEFEVYTKKATIELLGKYDISYIPKGSTTIINIDPYIRVKLPQP